MLAAEYILIDITLINCSPNFGSPISFGNYHQLSIFTQQQCRAEVTQNISTAESPGRCVQPVQTPTIKMNFELADKLCKYLAAQQLDTAIQVAEQELKRLATSPFHAVLGRNLLHLTPYLVKYIDHFYAEATKYFQGNKNGFLGSLFGKTSKPIHVLKTMYCEMNGFTINYDRWYIDLFAYTSPGKFDDLDWLSDFQYSSNESLTIEGFEDLQAIYKDYMENEKWENNHLQSCSDICEFLIIHRLQELFRNAFETAQATNLPWTNTPIYVTAHDYELIYRTRT